MVSVLNQLLSLLPSPGYALPIFLVAALAVLVFFTSASHTVQLPGPPGLPLFGNLLQMRTGHAQSLAKWAQQYGGMFRLALGEREAVIISTFEQVEKTLIQQGAAFQSRPEFKLWHGAFSRALDPDAPTTLGTSKFTEKITKYRKIVTAQTTVNKLSSFDSFVARRFLRLTNLLSESSKSGMAHDLGFHFWTTVIGVTADTLYGQHFDEETISLVADVTVDAFRMRSLATPLHDYVPLIHAAERIALLVAAPLGFILRPLGLSSWLDSIHETEKRAMYFRETEVAYCKQFVKELHERMDAGDTTPCQMGDIFRTAEGSMLTPNEELRLSQTMTGSGMSAGTSMAWLAPFLAAHPEMQEKAFAAIEEVYGGAVPDPLDTGRVDYITALGTEAGRYFASVRLGFPRETYEDVVVDGMSIPRGVLVVYNSFQINRDPQRYDRVEEFIPERWLDGHYGRTDVKQPKVGLPHLNHGAGRRFCMGVPTVNKMFYGSFVLLLHFFKLERAPLEEAARNSTFPKFRSTIDGEMSLEADPIHDQVSLCDAQAIPLPAGIKLTPRNPEALAQWLEEQRLEWD
ncbi:Cytochrome P450 phenylacetate [Mycena chlorophos]|uniref:Cytochrome P450 phenylacetate n=1 Tax=Mycena chlorophos TaxID=658473 RepID=A0A8H6TQ73_MYCCL|nr:Cytochrome P450 phenylacetate [Mycena chlorophos]